MLMQGHGGIGVKNATHLHVMERNHGYKIRQDCVQGKKDSFLGKRAYQGIRF